MDEQSETLARLRTACVVVAAGRGERLSQGRPKALVEVAGRSILQWALDGVRRSGVHEVVVVAPHDQVERVRTLCGPGVSVVAGGATRQASVRAGLQSVGPDVDAVLVHDAARCLTPPPVFDAVLAALAAGSPAVVPAVDVTDTLRTRSGASVVDRASLVAVQTPQGFARHVLDAVHAAATAVPTSDAAVTNDGATGAEATDDAGLVERAGVPVTLVAGHEEAFKVTRALDLVLAEALVRARTQAGQEGS